MSTKSEKHIRNLFFIICREKIVSEPFWIGLHINNYRAVMGHRSEECRFEFFRTTDTDSDTSAYLCVPGKIRVEQVCCIVRVMFHHLLDLDHAELVVVQHNYDKGRSYFTAVTNSAIAMENPPSPVMQNTVRPGYAILAAIAPGKPNPMVAR